MKAGKNQGAREYALLSLLYLLFLFMSKFWTPNFIDMESGDYSLMFINHYIFPRATELVGLGTNTTGRWSILIWNLYWPETYWLHVLGHVFVATTVFLLLQSWMRAAKAPDWLRIVLTLALALALARSVDAKFLLLSALVPLALPDLARRRSSALLLLLLAAVALAAHVKGTFLIATIGTFLFLLGTELLNRRLPLNAIALLAAFFGWMTVADIPWIEAWRQFALVQTSGHAYGELFYGPASPLLTALVVLGIGGAGALVVVANVARGLAGYLLIGFWAVLLFLVFKTSAVLPTGQHYIRWVIFLAAVGIMLGARHWKRVGPAVAQAMEYRPLRFGLPVLAVAALAGTAALPEARADVRDRVDKKVNLLSDEARHLAMLAGSIMGGGKLAERHRAAMQRTREGTPLPTLAGPVGLYVLALVTIPMAHDLMLRPLPILNLGEGWTREAIRQNREYLAGPSAPPHMLVRADSGADNVMLSIFEHYAPLSSHQSAFERQNPPSVNGSFLLLERRAPGSRVDRRPAGDATLRWNEAVTTPPIRNDEILVAEYAYQPTPLARLLGFLYRPPLVSIEIIDDRGHLIKRQRLASEVGPDGVIVSPDFSTNVRDMAAVASWRDDGQPRGPLADRIRFVIGPESGADWLFGGRESRWFEPTIEVRFRILRLSTGS